MELSWTVVPAPGPIGALTVGATAAGLALVAFGDRPEAAAHAAERLGLPPAFERAGRGGADRPRTGLDSASGGEWAGHGGAEVPAAESARPPAAVLEQAVAELREYFVGARRAFDVPLDWSLTRGSQRRVLGALFATVGYGATVTYGELGSAYTAARGVGAIMGSNPLPVVVPCHRVMAADGLGGFGGGRATKEWLLAHEGVLTGALDFG